MLLRSLLLAALAFLAAACTSEKKAQTAGPPPAVPVTIATASTEAVPLEIRVIGAVEASSTVQVKSQIAGELLRVRFQEGQNVKKGDLLFEIDPRPYQEALRQAEAAVERDQAQLKQAEAAVSRDIAQSKNADADAARSALLLKEGVTSRQQNDQVRTSADVLKESVRVDQAAVDSARASLNADRAAVGRAKLDLSYCEIRSAISGRTGNLLVHAGNLVKANDTALVVINQLSPVYATFNVPERTLASVRSRFNAGAKLPVQVSPQDAPGRWIRGVLSLVDNAVDTATGTIRLKATFANEDRSLWPGQFVNVVLTLDTQRDAIVVPAEAIQAGQQGTFVYVVKADKSVEPRVVTVGRTVERKVVIEKGITAGETVVTDGQLRLFPGARIQAVAAGNAGTGAL